MMQYLIVILILLFPATFYTLSYVRYNWTHKNKKAAFGLALMVAASIILPVIVVVQSE